MLQPIVNGNLLEVDGQRASLDAAFVLLGRMCPELPREYIQYLLAHPAALCEGCECEVVRIDLSKT